MRSCLFLFVLSILFTACSGGEQANVGSAESPDVTITLEGATSGTVLLIGQYMDQQYRVDSAVVSSDGSVHFERDTPYETGYYYAYFPDQVAVPFLLDQDQSFTISGKRTTPVEMLEVEGSVDNRLLYESIRYEKKISTPLAAMNQLISTLSPEQPEYQQVATERDQLLTDLNAFYAKTYEAHPEAFFTAFQRAAQNPPLRNLRAADGSRDKRAEVSAYREDFWNGVDFTDERLLRTPAIANKLRRYITELTPQHSDSIRAAADQLLGQVMEHPEYYRFFANFITREYQPGSPAVMDPEAVYVHMIQNYFTRDRAFWTDSMTVYGLQDQADMMAHSLLGQPGPNLRVNDLNGRPREIYAETAPFIVVYIYNPECDHCIEETPKLLKWYQNNRKQASVYALALDTTEDKWKSFVRNFGLQDWTNVYDPTNEAVYKTYFVDHTPEIYLLNQDRTIIAKNIEPADLDGAIARARQRQVEGL
ncbi:thiol-disulfide isomerase/thioredoxin [Lewinella marina]|uniref:DUF5106 domain-containing protein n=1 Tax=Neolewinella marina TaxID=438751 RepID=A0A2G0CF32_9BACT|nr:thioredoxin-like domain-containing protein [Neolewinella marina]NJB85737.1 thiol-disulfide isomerase/thioredoxin [Neolewinella marina]PHK98588.1 DUF5106 domain-containing protein [Neolewinella marina]